MLNVFVHLAYGFDATNWEKRYKSGSLIGLNGPSPYGYSYGEAFGVSIQFSRDHPESVLSMYFRYAVRAIIGFDLVHAWRNRKQMMKADVVWTHTESQHLAVQCVKLVIAAGKGPKVIAQTVWLFDRWKGLSRIRRRLYKLLIERNDVLTTHTLCNAEIAKSIFVNSDVRVVYYGIYTTFTQIPRTPKRDSRRRVIAVGNDRDRDWSTLVKAFGNRAEYSVIIVSTTARLDRLDAHPSIALCQCQSMAELIGLYRNCDCAVVSLKENFHASGITAVQEAIQFGLPVACANTGGISEYFSDAEINYFDPGDAIGLLECVEGIFLRPDHSVLMVDRAQKKMKSGNINAESFVRAHVEISREILGQ